MIFTKDNVAFSLLDVVRMDNIDVHIHNAARHFAALSYRFAADSTISYCGRTLRMQPGMISYIPADLPYFRDTNLDSCIVLHMDVFNYTTCMIETFVTAHTEDIGNRFSAIYDMWYSDAPDRIYQSAAMAYSLFAALHLEYTARYGTESSRVTAALDYIEEHYDDPELSVTEIARACGVCESSLRLLFREELGISPHRYLQRKRISQAASLLSDHHMSVAEAAHRSGFADEKYFSVVFRSLTGTSPSRYAYVCPE